MFVLLMSLSFLGTLLVIYGTNILITNHFKKVQGCVYAKLRIVVVNGQFKLQVKYAVLFGEWETIDWSYNLESIKEKIAREAHTLNNLRDVYYQREEIQKVLNDELNHMKKLKHGVNIGDVKKIIPESFV